MAEDTKVQTDEKSTDNAVPQTEENAQVPAWLAGGLKQAETASGEATKEPQSVPQEPASATGTTDTAADAEKNKEVLPAWVQNAAQHKDIVKPEEKPAESETIAENKDETKAEGEQQVPETKAAETKAPETTEPAEKKLEAKKAGILDNIMGIFATSDKKREEVAAKTDGQPGAAKAVAKEKQMTSEEKQKFIEAEKLYQEGMASVRDLIAPSSMLIDYDKIRIEGMYAQSFYVYAYPRFLDTNWLSPVINFDVTMDMAQYIYPIDSASIMRVLKRKVAQMQSALRIAEEKGNVRDPAIETALQDAEELRTEIQRGQEKFFQVALYFTIYSEDQKKLQRVSKQLESLLGGKLILTKRTEYQTEQAFNTTLPICADELEVNLNMNTSPLSTLFPFNSSELTSNKGILYGLNRHNDSLIIFDRFSLENANSVVFAKSGAGKSYAVKLEVLRSLMYGVDVIIIDPENEYRAICDTVGGSYLQVSLNADRRINPFDLPSPLKDEVVQPGDLLRANIITLHGLLKIMLGGVTPQEEAMLDKALTDVYALRGITMDVEDPSSFPPPTMEDLYDILSSTEGAKSLAIRLAKYTTGTYAGIFNKPTNIDLTGGLVVFSIRDLEDALRPIAMYIILNFLWSRVRSSLKKRLLVIDEAWSLMQHEDSAKFLYGLVKRARKYYLGVTTITQDVEDFVHNSFGRPIITNSSMQILLKQAPAALEMLQKIFNLTEGEKYMLLNSGIGQGLFFAGNKHVAIQIIASYGEDKLVTTNPEELLKAAAEAVTYAGEETPLPAETEAPAGIQEPAPAAPEGPVDMGPASETPEP